MPITGQLIPACKLFAIICVLSGVGQTVTAAQITIDTVPVGNLGNSDDTRGFGAVSYAYNIGIYEVTNAQYAAFLNAKAASDPLKLYATSMGSDARGGIARDGVDGSYSYSTKTNMADKPVNFVNWYSAIRFSNWLHNGQGGGDTESGAYTLQGGTSIPSNGLSITRNVGAKWFLTSEDEWHKAAYHQPAEQGGDVDDYWLYPTASNTAPTVATADSIGNISNPGSNVANYSYGAGWNGEFGNLTTVGTAGLLSKSYYGTSDQGGNVWEWTESVVGPSRVLRGGAYNLFDDTLSAEGWSVLEPQQFILENLGFRVATVVVPEPNSLALAILGLVGGLLAFRHRQGR